jgi:hypothetical protein
MSLTHHGIIALRLPFINHEQEISTKDKMRFESKLKLMTMVDFFTYYFTSTRIWKYLSFKLLSLFRTTVFTFLEFGKP